MRPEFSRGHRSGGGGPGPGARREGRAGGYCDAMPESPQEPRTLPAGADSAPGPGLSDGRRDAQGAYDLAISGNMTGEEADAVSESGIWEQWDDRQRARAVLSSGFFCVPAAAFHEAAEKALDRPVLACELPDMGRLLAELDGEQPAGDPLDALFSALATIETISLGPSDDASTDLAGLAR